MKKRRTFSAAFKTQVVLELISGRKAASELAREHELSLTLLSDWKAQFLERAEKAFSVDEPQRQVEEKVGELEQVIGRLTIENEALKKSLKLAGLSWRDGGRL